MMVESNQNPDKEQERRNELYLNERAELFRREVSNAESFDKAILTLSNAGLGFALVLINNDTQLGSASHKYLLYFSVGMFLLAVVLTLLTYPFGQRGIKKQDEFNQKIYLKNEKEARTRRNWPTEIARKLSGFSGVAYFLAVFSIVLFVGLKAC